MPKFKESDLGPLVARFLQQENWEIFQEVRMGGVGSPIVDIIGKKGPHLHGIELKRNLGLSVIRQASRNRQNVHYSSVAIAARRHPIYRHIVRTEDREFAIKICRDYKIGVFEIILEDDSIFQIVPPQLLEGHHEHIEKTIIPLLHDNHRLDSGYAKAGTKGEGIHTPYKEMIGIVKTFIEANPGCEIGQINAHLTAEHRQSRISYIPLSSTLMANLKNIERNWCIIKRPKGQRMNAYYVM